MKLDRRTVIKTAVAAGVAQIASPFVITARAADAIKIGMVDPLTGVYAAVANNEVIGAKFAVEQINAKGGVLGRPLELLVEDSANDVGTGVQKTRKLIERDQVQLHYRRRQFRHRPGHGAGHRRKEGAARRLRRPHRRHHRQGLQVERLSRLQHDAHGSQLGFRPSVHQVRQEVALHHAGLRLRSHLAAGGTRPT